MSNKGFLNLNRYKSSKSIKQNAKLKSVDNRNNQVKSRKAGP